jgi:hypothetical protein
VNFGSTSDLVKPCIFAPHRVNVQLMPPANQIHLTADGDSRQGSRISGNVQLASLTIAIVFILKYFTANA